MTDEREHDSMRPFEGQVRASVDDVFTVPAIDDRERCRPRRASISRRTFVPFAVANMNCRADWRSRNAWYTRSCRRIRSDGSRSRAACHRIAVSCCVPGGMPSAQLVRRIAICGEAQAFYVEKRQCRTRHFPGASAASDVASEARSAESQEAAQRPTPWSDTSEMRLPRIALTVGDPAGIGPEIVAKAAADPGVRAVCEPVVFAPPLDRRDARRRSVRRGRAGRVRHADRGGGCGEARRRRCDRDRAHQQARLRGGGPAVERPHRSARALVRRRAGRHDVSFAEAEGGARDRARAAERGAGADHAR